MPDSSQIPPVRVAHSTKTDAEAAAAELASALVHGHLGFVLFFCSAEYDLGQLGRRLDARFKGIAVAGCTTAGEITPVGYGRGCITAIGFDRRFFAIDYASIEGLDDFGLTDAQVVVNGLLDNCRDAGLAPIKSHTFAITLLDGLSSREELVLMSLNAALGSIPHFGGSAGDDVHLANTHVYAGGEFRTGAAVVIMVNTALDFEVFSTQHMHARTEKLVVTDAERDSRTVLELNAEPAAEEYARILGMPVSDLNPTVFALHPLAVQINNRFYVRSIQRANADGSLTFFCAVENGVVMTAMSPGPMLPNLKKCFIDIEARIGEPMLTIGCDCFLRRLELQHLGREDETSRFLVDRRVIGFNTYGEQFDGMHINQTFTGVVIGKRERQPSV
jgi:hypothetical protein